MFSKQINFFHSVLCLAESAGLLAAVLADRLLSALLGGAALLAAALSGVLAGRRRGSGCAFNSNTNQ